MPSSAVMDQIECTGLTQVTAIDGESPGGWKLLTSCLQCDSQNADCTHMTSSQHSILCMHHNLQVKLELYYASTVSLRCFCG